MIAEDPEKFSAYLRIQARFDRYTVTNAILLLHQFPDAQKLKTFEGWKREGASVKRGEKSISILEPYSYTKADGSMGKGFRIKKLFDICSETFHKICHRKRCGDIWARADDGTF